MVLAMRDITALEISAVVTELKGSIEGAWLKKFYDLGDEAFKFAFHKDGVTSILYIKLRQTMNLTKYTEKAEEAMGFSMGMRKRLENQMLGKVEQVANDRIVAFDFARGAYRLIVEMFGKGNMILTNGDGVVEVCYRRIDQKERIVKSGIKYVPPHDNETLPVEKITKSTAASLVNGMTIEKGAISSLALKLNLGPVYLEDLLLRSGIEPKEPELDDDQKEKLANEILELRHRLDSEKPRAYLNGKTVQDYSLFQLRKYEGLETKEFKSVSEMLDYVHIVERSSMKDTAKAERIRELTLNIQKQQELVDTLEKQTTDYAKCGHALLLHMQPINELERYLEANRKATLKEVQERFPALKIIGLDLKNKTVKIEVDA